MSHRMRPTSLGARPAWAALVLGLGAVVAGCGGSMQQVQGAQFDLSGNETSVADNYKQQEPREADAQTRCQYWSRRAVEAQGPQTIGILRWPPGSFPTLISWANAKRQQACGKFQAQQQAERAPPVITASAHDAVIEIDIKKNAQPLANTMVTVQVGPMALPSRHLETATGPDGHATVDLSGVEAHRDLIQSPRATLSCMGCIGNVTVNLSTLPIMAKWQADSDAADAQKKAADDQRRAEAAQRAQQLQAEASAEQAQEAAQCKKGDNAACLRQAVRNARQVRVKDVLVDGPSLKGTVVVLRNVIVRPADANSGFVIDFEDGELSQNELSLEVPSDAPRDAKLAWMRLPSPVAVVPQMMGLVTMSFGKPALLLLATSGGAAMR
jgi:hypothetical protein